MNVHYTWSRSIQSDTSRIQVLRGLYKCDSLNTLLSDNLNKATKKDSAQNVQILYLGKQLSEKDLNCKIEIDKAVKKQKKKGRVYILGTSIVLFAFGLII